MPYPISLYTSLTAAFKEHVSRPFDQQPTFPFQIHGSKSHVTGSATQKETMPWHSLSSQTYKFTNRVNYLHNRFLQCRNHTCGIYIKLQRAHLLLLDNQGHDKATVAGGE